MENRPQDAYARLEGVELSKLSDKELNLNVVSTTRDPRPFSVSEFKRCVIVIQPGASSSKCELPKQWKDHQGAPGCTGQAQGYQKSYDEFQKHGYDVFLCNHKSSELQRLAAQEKELSYRLISDPN